MKKVALKKGQALVEFALVFVLLTFMLSVLFDLGRAMVDYAILNNAVREGTRYAVVNPNGDIKGSIEHYYFNSNSLLADANIDLPPDRGGTSSNPTIIIHISYDFQPNTPGVTLLYPEGLTIDVQSEMFLTPNAK